MEVVNRAVGRPSTVRRETTQHLHLSSETMRSAMVVTVWSWVVIRVVRGRHQVVTWVVMGSHMVVMWVVTRSSWVVMWVVTRSSWVVMLVVTRSSWVVIRVVTGRQMSSL
eukprot:scaffold19921_cov39-Cyclotella_meneghiniana.AAC.3